MRHVIKYISILNLLLLNSFFGQGKIDLNIHLKEKMPLDSIVMPESKKNVFYGEFHDYKYTDKLALAIFKELVNKNKIDTYGFEGGKSIEYLFYYYLEKGHFNTENLNDDIKVLKRKFIKDFIKPLVIMFKANPKIKFRTFDIETDLFTALSVVNHILLTSKCSEKYSNLSKEIKIPSLNRQKLYKQCRLVINQFTSDSIDFKSCLNNKDFYYLSQIVHGILPGIITDSLGKLKKTDELLNHREKYVYENLVKIAESNLGCFFQIGLGHIDDNCSLLTKREKVINSFCRSDYFQNNSIKIGCIYYFRKKDENFWLLSKSQLKEIGFPLRDKFTFYDLSEEKNVGITKFDYIILCK